MDLATPTVITRRRKVGTDPSLCYATPPAVVRQLMLAELFAGDVWEPCCGDGSIARTLAERYTVHASDLHDHGYGETGRDVFALQHATNLVTNPPYGILTRFLEHALRITTA